MIDSPPTHTFTHRYTTGDRIPSVDVHMLMNALDNVCIMGGSYCPYGQASVELHTRNSVVVLRVPVIASICALQNVEMCS